MEVRSNGTINQLIKHQEVRKVLEDHVFGTQKTAGERRISSGSQTKRRIFVFLTAVENDSPMYSV
jgi:hypothetical protein